jgi:hypothetical protein
VAVIYNKTQHANNTHHTKYNKIPQRSKGIPSSEFYSRLMNARTLREEHRLRVFENRMLRRIFGPKRDEVVGGWRKQDNEELHNLYFSPSVIRIIKSRRMKWAGHAARTGRRGVHVGLWWESRKEKDH